MKFKKLLINMEITVKGIPNKAKEPKLLYQYKGNPTLETIDKLSGYLREWYPLNKKAIK